MAQDALAQKGQGHSSSSSSRSLKFHIALHDLVLNMYTKLKMVLEYWNSNCRNEKKKKRREEKNREKERD